MDLRTMHIGQKIKKLRELKNLTQTHMAQELGVTQSAYSKMELGESEVTYRKLEKISGVLEMKPEDVIASMIKWFLTLQIIQMAEMFLVTLTKMLCLKLNANSIKIKSTCLKKKLAI